MNVEKEKIFQRIREGLAMPSPWPGHHGQEHAHPIASAEAVSHWLPLVGGSFEERVGLFASSSEKLRSAFHLLENEAAARAKLAEVAMAEGWTRVAAHGDGTYCGSTHAMVSALGINTLWTDTGYDVREMEKCDAGISECDALVAQTGSVVVTSRSAGGRALSVLPPHHVVLARREQLLADLPDAFALLQRKYAKGYPSFMSFITGPSRTGDIERILVLGAHGPKKLTILCW